MASRIAAAEIERYDDQLDALDGMRPGDVIAVRIDWIADDDRLGDRSVDTRGSGPCCCVRTRQWATCIDRQEYIAIGEVIEARVRYVEPSNFSVAITLNDESLSTAPNVLPLALDPLPRAASESCSSRSTKTAFRAPTSIAMA